MTITQTNLQQPNTATLLQPANARELAAWLGENERQSNHPQINRASISKELELAMIDLATDREVVAYSDQAEITINLGIIRFFKLFGCRCVDTGFTVSHSTKIGKLELPDGTHVELALTPEIDMAETAAAKMTRAAQFAVARQLFASHDECIEAIGAKIETTLFKYCYEREDPSISTIVIVAAKTPLASVVARYLVEGRTAVEELEVGGRVKTTPSFTVIRDFCKEGVMSAQTNEMFEYLLQHLPQEVHSFYAPPFHFVQFTATPR